MSIKLAVRQGLAGAVPSFVVGDGD